MSLQRSLYRTLLRATHNIDTSQRMQVAYDHLSHCLPSGFVFVANETPACCLRRVFHLPVVAQPQRPSYGRSDVEEPRDPMSQRLSQAFLAIKLLQRLKHHIPSVAEWIKFYEHHKLAEDRSALNGSVIVGAAVLNALNHQALGADAVQALTEEVEAEVEEIVRTAYSHLSLSNDAGAKGVFSTEEARSEQPPNESGSEEGDCSEGATKTTPVVLNTRIADIKCAKERKDRIVAIVNALNAAMFDSMGYDICRRFDGRTDPLVITDVIRNRRGCGMMLAFVYQAAARRMGLPLAFQQHREKDSERGGPMIVLRVDPTLTDAGKFAPGPMYVVPEHNGTMLDSNELSAAYGGRFFTVDFSGLMAANMRCIVHELGSMASELRGIFLSHMKLILLHDKTHSMSHGEMPDEPEIPAVLTRKEVPSQA